MLPQPAAQRANLARGCKLVGRTEIEGADQGFGLEVDASTLIRDVETDSFDQHLMAEEGTLRFEVHDVDCRNTGEFAYVCCDRRRHALVNITRLDPGSIND